MASESTIGSSAGRALGARKQTQLLLEMMDRNEVAFSVGDLSNAHRRFKHCDKQHGLLRCQLDAEMERVAFGSTSTRWGPLALVGRPSSYPPPDRLLSSRPPPLIGYDSPRRREEIPFINSWLREKVKGGLVTGPGTGPAWLCCALLRYPLTGRVSGPAICPVLRSRASHAP